MMPESSHCLVGAMAFENQSRIRVSPWKAISQHKLDRNLMVAHGDDGFIQSASISIVGMKEHVTTVIEDVRTSGCIKSIGARGEERSWNSIVWATD